MDPLPDLWGFLTFPRVCKVCDGLGHDDGEVDGTVDTVHPELDKDVVQHMLHHIPVAHNSSTGFKGIPDVPSGCGVGVAVVASKGEGLAQLSVSVLGHDGGDC